MKVTSSVRQPVFILYLLQINELDTDKYMTTKNILLESLYRRYRFHVFLAPENAFHSVFEGVKLRFRRLLFLENLFIMRLVAYHKYLIRQV